MVSLIGLFLRLAPVIVASGIAITRFADRIAAVTARGHSLAGLLVLGLLYRAERRFGVLEPDSGLVILLPIGSLILIYQNRV